MQRTEEQKHKDRVFIAGMMFAIKKYAFENELKPNQAIKMVAEGMLEAIKRPRRRKSDADSN